MTLPTEDSIVWYGGPDAPHGVDYLIHLGPDVGWRGRCRCDWLSPVAEDRRTAAALVADHAADPQLAQP